MSRFYFILKLIFPLVLANEDVIIKRRKLQTLRKS